MFKSLITAGLLAVCFVFGTLPGSAASLTIEAESGVSGSDFTNDTDGAVQFISISTDTVNSGNPGNASRVASYTVTFPAGGTYQLYARVRVGPDTGNDDSLFFGNGFGVKSPVTNSDWIIANGITGFSNAADVVTGGGTLGSGMWRWINLTQKANQLGFAVSSTNLTQTFQIGARENGLDLDKFVFGLSGVQYTVVNLDAGADGTLPAGSATLNWTDPRQIMDGFGGGIVFLNGGATFNDANADKLFRTNTIAQLGLTLLRIHVDQNDNWANSVSAWTGNVADAKRATARGAGVLATPWSPPAAMKSNTNIVSGSLLPAQYANYAAYLEKFSSNMLANGVSLRAVSLQNEPDWDASYEGCLWSGAQFLNFFRTNAGAIKSAPVMIPESLGFNFSISDPSLNDSMAVTNIGLVGGHLYGVTLVNGFRVIQPYTNALSKGKRVWQTEYLENDQTIESSIITARQIHDCLTTGSMSAYIWWKCISTQNGLLNDSGVIQKRGYVMSQFSRFVRPGDYRMGETNQGSSAVSAYKNAATGQFSIIAINTYGLAFDQTITLTNFPSSVTLTPWITSATQSLATLPPINVTNGSFTYSLPANSIITFVGQAVTGPLGQASKPSPADGSTGVLVGSDLSWTAGSNTLTHAVYLGTSSNAVAQATTGSPEFQGVVSTASFTPTLAGGQNYYWRVDEISGANTNTGPVWTFSVALVSTQTPLADAYVESGGNAGVNFGAATNLLVKNNVTISTRNAYLMFNVHALANVQSATLTLMPNRVDDPSVKMYYELASTNWTESAITWNNQPGGTGVFFATNTVAVGVPVVIDVTSAVASRATNGGLLSIRITQPTNSLNGLIQFCSKEHPTNSWRPVLTYKLLPNTAPTLAAITNRMLGVGVTLNLTNAATDSDVPAQTLTFSLLTAPTNAVIDANSGVLTWRPLVTQADTTNPFTVLVADNGTPSLSATQSFLVTVNPLQQPAISALSATGGQLAFQVNGDGGPDYQIQASTNLVNWSAAFTTNSPPMPFVWKTGITNDPPNNFFRVLVGPPF